MTEPLDLAPIRARWSTDTGPDGRDIAALIAEVERLRDLLIRVGNRFGPAMLTQLMADEETL